MIGGLELLFESFLLDYNPTSNYGNWVYQAYVGNDSSYRIFDIQKQSNMYNGDDYINKWLEKPKSKININYEKMIVEVKKMKFLEIKKLYKTNKNNYLYWFFFWSNYFCKLFIISNSFS